MHFGRNSKQHQSHRSASTPGTVPSRRSTTTSTITPTSSFPTTLEHHWVPLKILLFTNNWDLNSLFSGHIRELTVAVNWKFKAPLLVAGGRRHDPPFFPRPQLESRKRAATEAEGASSGEQTKAFPPPASYSHSRLSRITTLYPRRRISRAASHGSGKAEQTTCIRHGAPN